MEEDNDIDVLDFSNKQEQVINLIKREFQNEINKRQEEVHLIQKRLLKARKCLHLLKYVVIKSFYDTKELNITNKDEFLTLSYSQFDKQATGIQNRIHPAVKKLLGKKPLDFNIPLARCREKVQCISPSGEKNDEQEIALENSNIILPLNKNQSATGKACENEENIPRGNQKKSKHEIIVGNISKYSPSNSAHDISSHKWMIYVRGPRTKPDISHIVKKVRFFLHPSYQPNDVIEIEESPFHLSRRGWGEFPVRVQIHFQNSSNKPIDIIHNLKLDQTRSGRQTLGNETFLNVWLYSDTDIKEETEDFPPAKRIKHEIIENEIESIENNITSNNEQLEDFYSVPGCSKNSQEPKSNFQENEINIIHNDSGFQVIKKEPISDIELIPDTSENSNKYKAKFIRFQFDDSDDAESDIETLYKDSDEIYDENRTFLFDHCYTDEIIHDNFIRNTQKYAITIPLEKFNSTRQIVYFLFKSLPLITHLAHDLTYTCCYPYVAGSYEEFASWNIGKQRCSEWYRAKEIKELLILHNIPDQKLWTIKFIIMFGRAHAFTPDADYKIFHSKKEAFKTVPQQDTDFKVQSTFTEFIPISEIMQNATTQVENNEDCIIDIENLHIEDSRQEKNTRSQNISSEPDIKLKPMCTYIKECAAEIDIALEDEEIIPNVLHNSAERVVLKAVMCLAEELIRSAWANTVVANKGRNLNNIISRNNIYQVLLEREEFDIFTNDGLGKDMNV